MNQTIKLPYLDNMMSVYAEVFPAFPQKCPVLTGPYYMRNVSNAQYDLFKDTFLSNSGSLQFNGEYKIDFGVFSMRDKDIFNFMIKVEVDSDRAGWGEKNIEENKINPLKLT